jgi:hypothetical protein
MKALLRQYFALQSGAPLTLLPSLMEIDGNQVPAAALQSVFTQLNAANTQADGIFVPAVVSGASATLTALATSFNRFTNAGAITLTLDYAYNVVNAIQNPYLGQTFPFSILTTGAGGSIATPTLSDTAITLSGTTGVSATSIRAYQGQITQLATTSGAAMTNGTTFTSLTQVGSTNAYTLALGTNALSPTVGQVIFLNVTTGTLPSGWYPIVKVTSATSFVIVAPIAGTAWTMTAGTVPGTTTVPVAQYQTGYTVGPTGSVGIFSPLVTLLGLYQATAAA